MRIPWVVLTVTAFADLLVDQSPYDKDNGIFSDGVAGQYYDQRMAEDFSLTSP